MHVLPTNLVPVNVNNNTNIKNKELSFKTYSPEAARKIEKELARKGIECHTKGNDFVANCCKKTVAVFGNLFDKSHLPQLLDFVPLDNCYAAYFCLSNKISFDSQKNNDCYYDIRKLKKEANKNYISKWSSSNHPAHTFVHEFSHCAHWHHLVERNGFDAAYDVWNGLVGTTVPTPIGRLITKFKLGRYAVEGKDMCEFLAEAMSKDICNGLTKDTWVPFKNIDVNYTDIFDRKWDYRYSSPQSYLDYFTQQVWNGDIDEANRTGDLVEEYLNEIEAERVSPTIQNFTQDIYPSVTISKPRTIEHYKTVETPKVVEKPKIVETPVETSETKTKSKSIFERIAQTLVDFNESVTDKLDERNKLILRR